MRFPLPPWGGRGPLPSAPRAIRRFPGLMVLVLIGLIDTTRGAELAAGPPPDGAPRRPNVLLILADDLGFSDLGCQGGEISTPEIDRLAAGGIRFTQFYNTARCWPTRAALLTGHHAQAVRRDSVPGLKAGVGGVRPPWAPLLPALLKPLGYRTYHSGKWHLDGSARDGGFDRSLRVEDFNHQLAPRALLEDDRPVPLPADGPTDATTLIAEHALRCLREHGEKHRGEPFFSFVAFLAPHFPLQAPASDVARCLPRYAVGWDAVRRARWERLRQAGIVKEELAPIERDVGPPYHNPESLAILGPEEVNRPLEWSTLTPAQQAFQASKMAIHAAMVEGIDREVGRLVAELRAQGALEDTLIIFLSDNGASAEILVRGDGHDRGAPPGSAATFLCLGPGWSSACNSPFRRHKTWVHEGGISTPFIVFWPRGLQARGELRRTPAHVIDIAPTILALAGGTWPSSRDGRPVPAPPGRSLVPVLARDGEPIHEALWWLHEGNRAVRVGDWKLVAAGEGRPWELYDLATDRGESRDLAGEQKDRVRELEAAWNRTAQEVFALARGE